MKENSLAGCLGEEIGGGDAIGITTLVLLSKGHSDILETQSPRRCDVYGSSSGNSLTH